MKRPVLLGTLLVLVILSVWFFSSSGSKNPNVEISKDDKQATRRPPLRTKKHADGSRDDIQAPEIPPAARIAEDISRRSSSGRSEIVDAQVEVLQNQLNLTPDQKTQIRSIIDLKGTAEGGVAPPLSALSNSQKSLPEVADEEIVALLTPAQDPAYQSYKKDRHQKRADAAVDLDLRRLQSKVDLDIEQIPKIRDAFMKLSWQEEETAHFPPMTVARFKERSEARRSILDEVLTPEQQEIYEKAIAPPAPPKSE